MAVMRKLLIIILIFGWIPAGALEREFRIRVFNDTDIFSHSERFRHSLIILNEPDLNIELSPIEDWLLIVVENFQIVRSYSSGDFIEEEIPENGFIIAAHRHNHEHHELRHFARNGYYAFIDEENRTLTITDDEQISQRFINLQSQIKKLRIIIDQKEIQIDSLKNSMIIYKNAESENSPTWTKKLFYFLITVTFFVFLCFMVAFYKKLDRIESIIWLKDRNIE
jgi:hypothetical protein